MRRKIDVAEVEAATKIRAKYLRALENEEFGLLPGNTFVKTFLRTYAEYLGLDAQLLIEEYRVEHEPRGEGDLQPYVSPSSRRRQQERRQRRGGRQPRAAGPPGLGTIVTVVVVVVIAILAILGLTSGDNGGGGGEKAATTPTTAKKKSRADRRAEKRRKAKPAPKVARVRVVPGPTGTYACVDHGTGTPTEEATLTAPKTFRGKHVRVNLGNSEGRLIANGKRVALEGTPPFGFDVTPTRTRPLPAGQRPCG